jgi:hypothetical protein
VSERQCLRFKQDRSTAPLRCKGRNTALSAAVNIAVPQYFVGMRGQWPQLLSELAQILSLTLLSQRQQD